MTHIRYKNLILISVLLCGAASSYAGGAKAPGEGGGGVAPPENNDSKVYSHDFVRAELRNFNTELPNNINIRPQCLSDRGIELIVLDAGHDDTPASTRSEGRSRPGAKPSLGRPKVHEGKLNMVNAWFVYDLLMRNSSMGDDERARLKTMIRFTRYPGERDFGQYEKAFGYSSTTQGRIDDKATNRKERVNYMMANHRTYDKFGSGSYSSNRSNVTSKTIVLSLHANNLDTEVYDTTDLSWTITPRNIASTGKTYRLARSIAKGWSTHFGDFFHDQSEDGSTVRRLKDGAKRSVELSRIKVGPHSEQLAMVSSDLGNSNTIKLLLEGFMMSGKVGHLANLDVTKSASSLATLKFSRSGSVVATYDVSEVYHRYAQSIVQGINDLYGCNAP